MRSLKILAGLSIGAWALFAITNNTTLVADGGDDAKKIALRDDCDPTDPGWAPTGGCIREEGAVRVAEFGALLPSLAPNPQLVGHPAWRIDPPYLKTDNDRLIVTNKGGRTHTFTEVAAFGGGFVPPLNLGQTPAPACLSPASSVPTTLAPGARLEVKGLAVGDHKFMCCIHPWMRAVVKVRAENED